LKRSKCCFPLSIFFIFLLLYCKEREGEKNFVGVPVATPLPGVSMIYSMHAIYMYTHTHARARAQNTCTPTYTPTKAVVWCTGLRHDENETDISAGSAPAEVEGHLRGELLYLISRDRRTLIKRPEINNVESRTHSRVASPPRSSLAT